MTKLLKSKGYQEELLLQACDWYRRLGLFREGFLLLSPREPLQRQLSTESNEGRRLLWAARFLNLMGATEFARSILRSLECESSLAHRIAGTVYLSTFDFNRAVHHFERMEKMEAEPRAYSARLGRLGFSDALACLGETDRALKIAEQVHAGSPEELLRGIARTAQGEYLARARRLDEALQYLNEAAGILPAEDQTPDQGLLRKWRGYVHALLGHMDDARADFAVARAILIRPSLRAEAGFDLLRLETEAGLSSGGELARVFHYPGISPGFRAYLPKDASTSQEWGDSRAGLRIDFSADEYEHQGGRFSGISKEARLIGHLAVAGSWGVSAMRMKSVLWPDEAYSFAQLESRLHQLTRRARALFGASIRVSQGMLRLESVTSGFHVRVGPPQQPSFLAVNADFRRKDLEKAYGIEKTRACELIGEWEENGWIESEGRGRALRYRRC